MPINFGALNTDFGQKLSDLFNPASIAQRRAAADEQAMSGQLRQMQVMQGVDQLNRAPVLARREEQQYQAQQAEAQRAAQERAQTEALFAQATPEQQKMLRLGVPAKDVFMPKVEKTPDWQNPAFQQYERDKARFAAGLKQHNPMVELKMQEMASGKEMAKKQQSLSAQQVLDQAATLYAHPGREMATGVSSFMSAIPGTDARGFKANLDTFKAQTFVPMVSALKGMGALSDAEGKKLSESVGALDPGMSEKEFASSLQGITKYLYDKSKAAGLEVSMPEFIGQGKTSVPTKTQSSANGQWGIKRVN